MKAKLISFLLSISSVAADEWTSFYNIEDIPAPAEVNPQIGGITALKNGGIAACFYSGEVMTYDPATAKWSPFAVGLQCPLGILEEEDGSLLVMQWAELTRLKDTNSDGSADFYQNVFSDFGISGNYHEFAYGPARDAEGNLYISLNVASNNAGIFDNVRGPFSPLGMPRALLAEGKKNPAWSEIKKDAGRMFSRVPYRGCIIKITPDGEGSPFAYGFRSPDGLGFDDEGRLWVTDNQGDWRGTSPLYHVTEGGFYGHPASLIWMPGWTQDPLQTPVPKLEKMRTRASGLFPHGELANSPTQPIPTIDPALFGLPKGEVLIGEMNQPTLIRFLPDEINGFVQGAMIPFLFSTDLGMGNHRLVFDEKGALWIGKTHLKWPGGEGLKRITWNKKPVFLVEHVTLLEDGFEILFNQALGASEPAIAVSRHTYAYHSAYGSPKIDLRSVEIQATRISDDRRSLRITLPRVEKHHLYTIEIEGAADREKNPLLGTTLRYNVVKTAPSKE